MTMVGGAGRESRRGSKMTNLRKFHYGLVSVSDGKCRPQASRIKLCSEYLVLQREEFHIWEDEETYPVEAGLRYLPNGGAFAKRKRNQRNRKAVIALLEH